MIQIKEVREIDPRCIEALTPNALVEFNSNTELRNTLLKHSSRIAEIWVYGLPVCVVGMFPLSLIGGGNRLWFLPCIGLQIHGVVAIRAMRQFYDRREVKLENATAYIKLEEQRAQKFARFFGFVPSEQVFDGYRYYRMKV
jgi:hypothetical protein